MHEREVLKDKAREIPIAVNPAGLSIEAKAMFHMVATRAYELFEGQGKKHGHDLDHWLQAEAELFGRPALTIAESEEGVTILAHVRGFTPRELEIDLEPRRVTIVGTRQSNGEQKGDGRSTSSRHRHLLLRSLRLPVEIDTQHATARFIRKGVLELDLKKADRPNQNSRVSGQRARQREVTQNLESVVARPGSC
jgi:HSP20 family molecular chaperone IbpA